MVTGPVGTVAGGGRRLLWEAAALLPPEPWDHDTWGIWTERVKLATGRKGKALFMPLRLALTGLDHGPELKALLPLIGPEQAKARLAPVLSNMVVARALIPPKRGWLTHDVY